jgi:preprotein translocase subunit SecG
MSFAQSRRKDDEQRNARRVTGHGAYINMQRLCFVLGTLYLVLVLVLVLGPLYLVLVLGPLTWAGSVPRRGSGGSTSR